MPSPEVIAAIGSLVDRYGLPLGILAGLGWLLLTRRLVLGSELVNVVAELTKTVDYVEARRLEERQGRLAAEQALRDLAAKQAESAEATADSIDHMADAIEGRTPRARR